MSPSTFSLQTSAVGGPSSGGALTLAASSSGGNAEIVAARNAERFWELQRRWWRASALFAAVVSLPVLAWLGTQAPQYRAEALLRLDLPAEMPLGSALLAVRDHRMAMETGAYREYFLDRLDPRDREIWVGRPDALWIRAFEVRNSHLIRVVARSADAELSARLANQFAQFYGDYLGFREKSAIRESYERMWKRETEQELQVERSREAVRKYLLNFREAEGTGLLAERRRLQLERESVARDYAAAEIALLDAAREGEGGAGGKQRDLTGLEKVRRETSDKLADLDLAIRKIDSGAAKEDEQSARFASLKAQVESDERLLAELRDKVAGLKMKMKLSAPSLVVIEDEAGAALHPEPPGRWGSLGLSLLVFAAAFLAFPFVRRPMDGWIRWPWTGWSLPREMESVPDLPAKGSQQMLAACFEPPVHDGLFRITQELERAFSGQPHQCLLVTSVREGEGKSFLSAGLAVVASAQGRRILLVDGHLASPSAGIWFPRADSGCGLLEWLQSRGDGSKQLSCQRQGEGGQGELYVVSSRGWASDSAALLRQPCFAAWLRRARDEFDWVILDGPEVSSTGDVEVLAALSDGVLFVRDGGITTLQDLGKACQALEASGARILGHVGNRRPGERR